jgi:hypothetical protein
MAAINDVIDLSAQGDIAQGICAARRRVSRISDITDDTPPTRPIQKVGIVGAARIAN